jgi:hypothetical protein
MIFCLRCSATRKPPNGCLARHSAIPAISNLASSSTVLAPIYGSAIHDIKKEGTLRPGCRHRPSQYLNNTLEQDHRAIERSDDDMNGNLNDPGTYPEVKPGVGKQSAAVALGMGRSGSSPCTSVLDALGVVLGNELVSGDQYNEPGYFEDGHIRRVRWKSKEVERLRAELTVIARTRIPPEVAEPGGLRIPARRA